MPWELEQALICDRLGWSKLPHELEEVPTNLVRVFHLLDIYRAHQAANEDLEKLSQRGLELYAEVQELRARLKNSSDNDG